ncbi:MAG: LysM peptidoglycan-binding domain-containing protein [Flavobacteriales bacterium]|nr:LysM peptidoglycan-binding domain-containing protein [Flavobacteriales bacterium]
MTFRNLPLFVLLLAGLVAQAQEVRVLDGRKYNVHRVQAGQTLYAISRSYAVSVEDLMTANPGASDGLSIGEELLVPLDAVQKKELRTAPILRNDGELLHTVRKKETLYGIARSYGMDMNILLERNPDAINLKEGMVLVIPIEKVSGPTSAALAPAMSDSVTVHEVGPGETLYFLGRMYGVPVESIQQANGGLAEGLKAGMRIRIPGTSGPMMLTKDSSTVDHSNERFKVAFLLPFSIPRNDSVLALVDNSTAHRYYEPTRIAVQFYNGAKLALDSLEKLGLRADVTVLDMGEDQRSWNSVVKRPELSGTDLFIGPFHRSAIEQVARANRQAHVVCPVPQSNKVLLGMPNVSKVTPTRSEHVQHTARYVAQKHAKDLIILVRPEIPAEKDLQDQMATALRGAMNTPGVLVQDSLLVVKPGLRDMSPLTGKLSTTRLNVLVVPSENIEFLTSLVVKLKPLADKYRIALVGLEKWTTYESLAAIDLDVLGFRYAASSFLDPKDPRVMAFTKAYRNAYRTDVDEYAFLGFDVTMFYGKALMSEGSAFPQHFDRVHSAPLHMGFRMEDTGPESGFRNGYALMLMQKDLQLIKAP